MSLLFMKWVYPGRLQRRFQGPWGGEPGGGNFGFLRRVLALLGYPCPPGAPFVKESLKKTYSRTFSLPEDKKRNCLIKPQGRTRREARER
jgi:hypothetical protein